MKIFCDTKKERLNLTISTLLKSNKKITFLKDLQKEVLNLLPPQAKIRTYVYPGDTLHFSILNLTSFDLSINFSSARKTIELQKWYDELKKVMHHFLKELPPLDLKVEKFYFTKEGKLENSIALNLKPLDSTWIKKLAEVETKIKKELYRLNIPIENFGIKMPGSYFVVNILRFFDEPGSVIENCEKVYEFLEKKNKDFEKINYNLKIKKYNLVVSDQYLSNPNPIIL